MGQSKVVTKHTIYNIVCWVKSRAVQHTNSPLGFTHQSELSKQILIWQSCVWLNQKMLLLKFDSDCFTWGDGVSKIQKHKQTKKTEEPFGLTITLNRASSVCQQRETFDCCWWQLSSCLSWLLCVNSVGPPSPPRRTSVGPSSPAPPFIGGRGGRQAALSALVSICQRMGKARGCWRGPCITYLFLSFHLRMVLPA